MTEQSDYRRDFIQRLFAVAVSVGFASSLVKMKFIEDGLLPQRPELEQFAILAVGLTATALSWDGYLMSIKDKPLKGEARFLIDIGLVFLYLFLLVTSAHSGFWLPTLVAIFAVYVLWDGLTVSEYMWEYDKELAEAGGGRAKLLDVLQVYERAFRDRPATKRGPVITLSWFVYFACLSWINAGRFGWQVFAMAVAAIVGLRFYRHDKRAQLAGREGKGYTMPIRLAIIVGLLAVLSTYAWLFRLQ